VILNKILTDVIFILSKMAEFVKDMWKRLRGNPRFKHLLESQETRWSWYPRGRRCQEEAGWITGWV